MVVTHGDADHFAADRIRDRGGAAKLFIAPARIFHNGLVKRTLVAEAGRRDGGVTTALRRPAPSRDRS